MNSLYQQTQRVFLEKLRLKLVSHPDGGRISRYVLTEGVECPEVKPIYESLVREIMLEIETEMFSSI